MAIDVSEVTAQPAELELDGKVWRFSPLTISDYGDIERAMRDEIIASALRTIGEGSYTQAQQDAMMRAAFDAANRVTLESLNTGSVSILRKIAFLSLRKTQPGLRPECVNDLLDAGKADRLRLIAQVINQVEGGGAGADGGATKS